MKAIVREAGRKMDAQDTTKPDHQDMPGNLPNLDRPEIKIDMLQQLKIIDPTQQGGKEVKLM